MYTEEILAEMRAMSDPKNVAGMARFGINSAGTLGISIPTLRGLAKRIGHDHQIALELWESGVHEARILAGFVDRPEWVDEAQLEKWVKDIDSWDVCDMVCGNLFDKTPWAVAKAEQWCHREEEFVRRAGFVLMAALAVHSKETPDTTFAHFFTLIEEGAGDPRNFVKKAVNWALRQIGKRRYTDLREPALVVAQRLAASNDPVRRWIGKDAARELSQARKGLRDVVI